MNLIDHSIRRPVFAWVLMFALIVFGAISMMRLGISQMPDVDFPVLSISVAYDGAAPAVVESDLIDPIEAKLLSIEGIKEMRATASQGSGRVNLEFDINRNVDVALQEAQSAISQLRLPEGVDPPVIRKQNPDDDPILYISIFGTDNLKEMLGWLDVFFLDQLRFLPGVGEVSIQGFSDRNLRIWLKPDALAANYLAISDVIDALRTQHIESTAGQITEGRRELRVRWMGEATNVDQVGDIQIIRRGGGIIHNKTIRIKDVADVEDGLSDIRRLSRVNGKQAVNISIKKQRGTNEVTVAKAVRAKLAELKSSFPKGYDYQVNVDFTRSTEATVDLTIEKLWVAALITIVICFLFLGSFQAAVNILFSIPTSIVGTFTIVYFAGFTLNLFTLLALTLAISIVVDDAIMLLENIMRHYHMGKNSSKASSHGAKEVLPAAMAATLAVVAVFLPVIFMKGIVGKFFFQFGITMSAAVLLSLLEAVTITPMRTAAFLGAEPKISRFEKYLDHLFERLASGYRRLLQPTLRFKWLVLGISIGIFFVSLLLVKKVRQEFVPSQDQDLILVTAQTPTGSSLEFTDQIARELEAMMKNEPEVESFFVSIGGGGPAGGVNSIFMPLKLLPRDKRDRSHTEIMNALRPKFREIKGVRVTMRDPSARNLASGRQNPVAFNIRGPDLSLLNKTAIEIVKRLETEKLAVDLDQDYKEGIPELRITPSRDAMAARGVSAADVGGVLSAAVGGLRQGQYTTDGRRYDIRFKIHDELIHGAEDITKLFVRNIAGNLVPLSELVKVEEASVSQSINRVNRQRSISIYGNLAPGQSQSAVLERAETIAKELLPTGYAFSFEGAAAGFGEAFGSLGTALMVGILVAYLILAVQFNSFIHPVSVLIALPFSVTGALLTLWITQNSLNLFSFIGLIVLMGIAKKNSILLVEFTNQMREKKLAHTPIEALLQACPVRLRPVLMTSVATVAAAGPLAFGHGLGHEARSPMGLAIIGGTIVSTILTLFVVPALYLALSKLERPHKEVEL
ncbi:MAG: efflux RND transporter permease subunit [Bacteriovoracia bacterium]